MYFLQPLVTNLNQPLCFQAVSPFRATHEFPEQQHFRKLKGAAVFIKHFRLKIMVILQNRPADISSLFKLVNHLRPGSGYQDSRGFPTGCSLISLFKLFSLCL